MTGYRRILITAATVGIIAGACTSVSPTVPPAPTVRPTIAGPGWVQAAADRWGPGSPQWLALAGPDVPYRLGGSAFGNPNSVTFTPAQARLWWDHWFSSPVDLAGVDPGFLPGNLVLSPEELKKASLLMGRGNALPKAPRDYNPLGLPVLP